LDKQEWEASSNPEDMLHALVCMGITAEQDLSTQPHTARRTRLAACGCTREVWHLLDEQGRSVVEVAERYVDGLATEEELVAADGLATSMIDDAVKPIDLVSYVASDLDYYLRQIVAYSRPDYSKDWGVPDLHQRQAVVFRDVYRNPYKAARVAWVLNEANGNKVIHPAISHIYYWNGQTVPRLAADIYAKADFGRMKILGDALEDAGCEDAEMLEHARSAGPHVKGCWLLDYLLGRP